MVVLADTPGNLPVPAWKDDVVIEGAEPTVSRSNAFDSLPDFDKNSDAEGTEANVPVAWQSPFAGRSLGYVSSWVACIPKPPKAVNKTYFAVLQRELYERDGKVLICRRFEGRRKPQTIPVRPEQVGGFQISFRRERWKWCYKDQSILA